jgi:hypothetical protein
LAARTKALPCKAYGGMSRQPLARGARSRSPLAWLRAREIAETAVPRRLNPRFPAVFQPSPPRLRRGSCLRSAGRPKTACPSP